MAMACFFGLHSWNNSVCFKCGKVDLVNLNVSDRLEAIKNVNDQRALVKVATKDKDVSVRVEAIKRVNDQRVLVKLATKDKHKSVRIESIKRVNEQFVLEAIARSDKNDDSVRCQAIENISSQFFLQLTVNSCLISKAVQQCALSKLNDRSMLLELAKQTPTSYNFESRMLSINKIVSEMDEDVMIDLILPFAKKLKPTSNERNMQSMKPVSYNSSPFPVVGEIVKRILTARAKGYVIDYRPNFEVTTDALEIKFCKGWGGAFDGSMNGVDYIQFVIIFTTNNQYIGLINENTYFGRIEG
jgi:hypothetical protein